MPDGRWVVFALGPGQYAAPVERVREILKPVPWVRMPRAAPFVRGLFNLRGQAVPLVDTKARLGLASGAAAPGRERVMVVETASGAFGLEVDEVLEVLRGEAGGGADPGGPLEMPDAPYVASVLDFGGRLVFTLDLERLVSGADGSGVPLA